MLFKAILSTAVLALTGVSAHWCWPSLGPTYVYENGWDVVRKTDNFETRNPLKDVTAAEFTCYNGNGGSATAPHVYNVTAGQNVTFWTDNNMYHIGVLSIYMAKAPGSAITFDGKGQVWFKIFQISGVADPTGASYPTFPATGLTAANFPIPKSTPNGQYLLRAEYIALHDAYYFGGAQYYIGCAQVNVSGGGSGTPGPLVSIPGVYTGNEPGIIYDPYRYPTQTSYIMPGPAVWKG